MTTYHFKDPEVVTIGKTSVYPGTRKSLEIPVGRLPTQTPLYLPVEVVNGSEPGPRLWVSAALHGDEVNGVEIVREVLERLDPLTLRGAVVAVPIVNVFGFLNGSRYLPDRRDLNRSFPGSKTGSLAARLARLFLEEIVAACTHGIDLHTAAEGRYNHPHIRGNLNDPETRKIAEAFGAPVMMSASAPAGSLRHVAANRGIPILLFEGGEAKRFDKYPVSVGVEGILRVMDALDMRRHVEPPVSHESLEATTSKWVRAKRAGILRLNFESGDFVSRKQLLGTIGDVFERTVTRVVAPFDGIILSHVTHPLVHQGDALVHVGAADLNRR